MPMNARLLRPLATGFTPRRLGGLGAWFDATDASTYTLDTGVSEWRCKAVSGQKFSQSSGASQPTINATGIGGKPTLSFDASNDWMDLGSQTIGGNNLLAEAANAYSLYIVVRRSGGGVNTLFAKASATLGNRTLQVFSSNGDFSAILRGTQTVGAAGSLPSDVDGLVRVSWSGTAAAGAFNAVETALSAGAAAVEAENITIGARTASSPAVFWSGLIGEIVFYNKALSSTEQASLFSYFNAKWGLSLT